jgi:hypothetical protein
MDNSVLAIEVIYTTLDSKLNTLVVCVVGLLEFNAYDVSKPKL